MIVAELERALLARYPKADAEGWDHVGLSVGDPAAEITGVVCALDATEANVRRALEAGANVLLTHHPIYIKAPEAFCPADSARPQCSAALYEAARCGVSIISLHTNLDRSPKLGTNRVLAERLDLWTGSLAPELEEMGVLGELPPCPAPVLAQKAKEALGCASVNFYDAGIPCRRIAVVAGSGGSLLEEAAAAGADTLITGDVKQDVFVSAQWLGMNLLEVSHFDLENPVFSKLGPWLEDTLGIRTCLSPAPKNPVQWI